MKHIFLFKIASEDLYIYFGDKFKKYIAQNATLPA